MMKGNFKITVMGVYVSTQGTKQTNKSDIKYIKSVYFECYKLTSCTERQIPELCEEVSSLYKYTLKCRLHMINSLAPRCHYQSHFISSYLQYLDKK